MKKKLISLLLVSAMAAATAGCGSSVPANSVNSRDDLAGKKIGVQLGTTGDSDATEYEKNDGSTVERYNKGASHFMRYFKETMGTSFVDYLRDYRLTIASRLLTTSDSSILDIAAESGFENLSYFNRVFKQKYSMTPRLFR